MKTSIGITSLIHSLVDQENLSNKKFSGLKRVPGKTHAVGASYVHVKPSVMLNALIMYSVNTKVRSVQLNVSHAFWGQVEDFNIPL